jgi:alkylated DNA nucleotide flippase Atl1
MARDARTAAILELVDAIPRGRVMTYGDVARTLGIASPRLVGQVMARDGHEVAWHRVVRATGRPADHLVAEQCARLAEEGVPLCGRRVDLAAARWLPGSAARTSGVEGR